MSKSKFTPTSKKIIRKIFHLVGIINEKPLAVNVAPDRNLSITAKTKVEATTV